MRIPPEAAIDEAKLTNYLLRPRPWDDKSRYLEQAGFGLGNWRELLVALRRLADTVDAVEDRTSDYGTFYRIDGMLEGPSGRLAVTCIWMRQATDGHFRFVTLKPAKGRSGHVPAPL